MKKLPYLSILFLILTSCLLGNSDQPAPGNIILLIGDGMGPSQITAASRYLTGEDEGLSFYQMPHRTEVTTFSADNSITDSAAAATAMATGQKVNNGVISQAIPGDGTDLETILELAQQRGYNTALITTAHLNHATPAAFASHTNSRSNYSSIGLQLVRQSGVNILYGGGHMFIDAAELVERNYDIYISGSSFAERDDESLYQAGLFGEGHMPYILDGRLGFPGLKEMTSAAIETLVKIDDAPFFIMVEAARIDHACHNNDIDRMIPELLELHETVEWLLLQRDVVDTSLILVTADHETGGLEIINDSAINEVPQVGWSTGGHSDANVFCFASGIDPHWDNTTQIDNTQIFHIMKDYMDSYQ